MNNQGKIQTSDVETTLRRLCAELRERQVAKLPSERALAGRLNSSRGTIRKILNALEQEGEVYRIRGRSGGAFLHGIPVTPPSPQNIPAIGKEHRLVTRDLNRAVGVPQLLVEQGYNSGTQVVRAVLEDPPATVAKTFGDTEVVVSLMRIRYADGEALSLDHAYLPAKRFPGLLHHRLNISLYELLEKEYGVAVGRTNESIEVTLAPSNLATLLDCEEETPLLKLTRVAWDTNGKPMEYSIDLFRADRIRLVADSTQASPVGVRAEYP